VPPIRLTASGSADDLDQQDPGAVDGAGSAATIMTNSREASVSAARAGSIEPSLSMFSRLIDTATKNESQSAGL
jgi:hypothetical protein